MIDISKLTEADRGREVCYRTPHFADYGCITSWNRNFVFVRYHRRQHLNGRDIVLTKNSDDPTRPGDATRPEDLEFV